MTNPDSAPPAADDDPAPAEEKTVLLFGPASIWEERMMIAAVAFDEEDGALFAIRRAGKCSCDHEIPSKFCERAPATSSAVDSILNAVAQKADASHSPSCRDVILLVDVKVNTRVKPKTVKTLREVLAGRRMRLHVIVVGNPATRIEYGDFRMLLGDPADLNSLQRAKAEPYSVRDCIQAILRVDIASRSKLRRTREGDRWLTELGSPEDFSFSAMSATMTKTQRIVSAMLLAVYLNDLERLRAATADARVEADACLLRLEKAADSAAPVSVRRRLWAEFLDLLRTRCRGQQFAASSGLFAAPASAEEKALIRMCDDYALPWYRSSQLEAAKVVLFRGCSSIPAGPWKPAAGSADDPGVLGENLACSVTRLRASQLAEFGDVLCITFAASRNRDPETLDIQRITPVFVSFDAYFAMRMRADDRKALRCSASMLPHLSLGPEADDRGGARLHWSLARFGAGPRREPEVPARVRGRRGPRRARGSPVAESRASGLAGEDRTVPRASLMLHHVLAGSRPTVRRLCEVADALADQRLRRQRGNRPPRPPEL